MRCKLSPTSKGTDDGFLRRAYFMHKHCKCLEACSRGILIIGKMKHPKMREK